VSVPVSALAAASVPVRGHHVGRLVGAEAGRWLVDYPGNPHGPLPARATVALDAEGVRRAAAAGTEALLVFEGERSDRPIVVGLLAPPCGEADPMGEAADAACVELVVDGERVLRAAGREVVLRCGKASIQLVSDGTVRIRGTNVLSRASATNRIRGGNVQIN
jgi:hypothetical protein